MVRREGAGCSKPHHDKGNPAARRVYAKPRASLPREAAGLPKGQGMSTKPAITEGHISGRQEAGSHQVMRVAVICGLLAGIVLLTLALLVAVGRVAVAQTEPTMNVACESNKTGQMRYVTSASQCNSKKETSLTW